MTFFVLLFNGCESTQDKSARLAREGGGRAGSEKGLVVRSQTSKVKVVSTSTLQDANGTAVVVSLRNVTRKPLVRVPIAIKVTGKRKKTLFRNDAPGLEPSLVGVPVLMPRQRLQWVNDQVVAEGRPRAVAAKIGGPRGAAPSRIPTVTVTEPRLERDPVSGTAAVGFVANRSDVEQRKLVVYAVARRGGRVVAAGRGQIARLKPHKRARYRIFFIGDPAGAAVTVAALPTQLG